MNFSQLRDLALSVGFSGDDADVAAAIALAESGGNQYAQGDPRGFFSDTPNGTSTSFGLWQVHTPSWPQFDAQNLLDDPSYNAKAAFAIYRTRGGRFTDWSTYNNGDYESHLPATSPAVPIVSTRTAALLKLVLAVGAVSIVASEVIRHGGIANAWHAAGRTVRRYV